MTKQFNVRLPKRSEEQVATLCERFGMTKTQLIILALDRLERDTQGIPQYAPAKDAELLKKS